MESSAKSKYSRSRSHAEHVDKISNKLNNSNGSVSVHENVVHFSRIITRIVWGIVPPLKFRPSIKPSTAGYCSRSVCLLSYELFRCDRMACDFWYDFLQPPRDLLWRGNLGMRPNLHLVVIVNHYWKRLLSSMTIDCLWPMVEINAGRTEKIKVAIISLKINVYFNLIFEL